MAKEAKFTIVDVFTSKAFGGNQLAVYADGSGVSTAQMQSLAHEINFSESTFVLAPKTPGAPRRVRIFTPRREIPMAGHPTVGTAWVLAARGDIALRSASVDATLRLGVGPITVTIESKNGKPRFVWMAHKAPVFGAVRGDRANVARALGVSASDLRSDLPIEVWSTGLPVIFVPLKSLDALARCTSSEAALSALFRPGETKMPVHIFAAGKSATSGVRARMFAPHTDGIAEDPATGGAAAPFGAYAAKHGLLPDAARTRFTIDQGIEMGRPSRIQVEVTPAGGGVVGLRIGGQCTIVGEGTFRL